MATTGRRKRKRKSGARTGVTVKPHVRSPRGPNSRGGKRKPTVRVDPYSRGKPKATTKKLSSSIKKRRKARKKGK